VCGLKNEATQRRLLSEKDLTFQKACDTAQAMELAAKDTAEFTGKTPASDRPSTDWQDQTEGAAVRETPPRRAQVGNSAIDVGASTRPRTAGIRRPSVTGV
jgi:hypothetical protein